MNKKFGIVGNKFITDCEVDNIIVDVYTILRTINYHIEDATCDINISTLYKILSVPESKKVAKDEIKNALQWLVDNKYISITDLLDNEFTVVNDIDIHEILTIRFIHEEEGNIESGGFTKIPAENIKAILNYIKTDKTIKKYSLIRYYLIIARACSNSASFGSISYKKIKDKMEDIGEKTCAKYNEILSDIGVIFYNNDYGYIDTKGRFKLTGTMYGHRNVANERAAGELTQKGFDSLVDDHVKGKYVKINKEAIAEKKSNTMKKTLAEKKANQIIDRVLKDRVEMEENIADIEDGKYIICSHDEKCRQVEMETKELTLARKKLISVGLAREEYYSYVEDEIVNDVWGQPSCF